MLKGLEEPAAMHVGRWEREAKGKFSSEESKPLGRRRTFDGTTVYTFMEEIG